MAKPKSISKKKVVKKKGGKVIEPDIDLKEKVDIVLKHIEADIENMKDVYTFVHICSFLKISTSSWYLHLQKPINANNLYLLDTIKRIKDMQQVYLENLGLFGKVPPGPWAMIMKNKFGYRDNPDYEKDNSIEIKLNYKV